MFAQAVFVTLSLIRVALAVTVFALTREVIV